MFVDSDFVIQLAYLCDIFEKLNSLNISLQGKETHILQLYDKIVAFIKKNQLMEKKINSRKWQNHLFSTFEIFFWRE